MHWIYDRAKAKLRSVLILNSILNNIIKHPNDTKYKNIDAAKLQKKFKAGIDNFTPLLSVLQIIGFNQKISENNSTLLILSDNITINQISDIKHKMNTIFIKLDIVNEIS